MGVHIYNGLLNRYSGEVDGFLLPGLDFQVFEKDGKPVRGTYHGDGVDHGQTIMVGDAGSISLTEYNVSERPTDESVARRDGFLHRLSQSRKVFPKNKSAEFQDGWRDADKVLSAETQEQRESRKLRRKLDKLFF